MAAAGRLGRSAGQHAEGGAPLAARANRGDPAFGARRPVPRPALGASVLDLRGRKAGLRGLFLGRLPADAKGRERAERTAAQIHAHLEGRRATDREIGRALGIGNSLRYATTTGTVAIRWDGARAPVVWTVAGGDVEPAEARNELARRHLHVFGPTTAERFARWAGIARRSAAETYASLEPMLTPVRSPLGEEWLLATDEPTIREAEKTSAPSRLLPSGDTYFLLDGAERELLLPQAEQRQRLWTSRVWPGALLVDGEIRGTWRRAQHTVRIDAWTRLSPAARAVIEAEARSLPLPGLDRPIEVIWER